MSTAKSLPTKEAPGAGGGGSLSGTNVDTSINDPATVGAINDNRVSLYLARLAAANTWSSFNTFSAGLSANNAPVTNVDNAVNGGDAINKNYFDANAVRFMPAAPQLTVGDVNGTAAMTNLRGQSTCCGPTTGFADFKVFQNGSFVTSGSLGIGINPMPGPGYRTSWDTYKGAFRSPLCRHRMERRKRWFLLRGRWQQLDRDGPLLTRVRRHQQGFEHEQYRSVVAMK